MNQALLAEAKISAFLSQLRGVETTCDQLSRPPAVLSISRLADSSELAKNVASRQRDHHPLRAGRSPSTVLVITTICGDAKDAPPNPRAHRKTQDWVVEICPFGRNASQRRRRRTWWSAGNAYKLPRHYFDLAAPGIQELCAPPGACHKLVASVCSHTAGGLMKAIAMVDQDPTLERRHSGAEGGGGSSTKLEGHTPKMCGKNALLSLR